MAINPFTDDRLRSTTLEDALAKGASVLSPDDPDLLRAVTARTRVRPMAPSALSSSRRELPSLAPRLAIPPPPAGPDRAEQMSTIGKAVSAVGKALQEPGVREVLAEFGMAFTARNQNSPGFQISQAAATGARREIEARGLAEVIAGRTSAAVAGGASADTISAGTQARQADERQGLAERTESRLAEGQEAGIGVQKEGLEIERERVGVSKDTLEFRKEMFRDMELPASEVRSRIAERDMELTERMQPFIEGLRLAQTTLAEAQAKQVEGTLDAETVAKVSGDYSRSIAQAATARSAIERSLIIARSMLINPDTGKQTDRAKKDHDFKVAKVGEIETLKIKLENLDRIIESQSKKALEIMGNFEEAPSVAVDPATLTPTQRDYMEASGVTAAQAAQLTDEFLKSKGF